jgi:3-oxoacyl-[acyl-carrier-protein] synthase-1
VTPLAITGIGAVTAIGSSAGESAASARAGLMGFGEYPYQPIPLDGAKDDDRPLLAARVGDIDPDLDGPSRVLELAALVHADLLRDAELHPEDLRGAALLVSLPAGDAAAADWSLGRDFVSAFGRRTGLVSDHVRVVESGAAGMLELCGEAARLLASRAVKRCVLLGADSYLAEGRLKVLDAAYRIKTPRNVDGFIPGEAATAVLVETPERAAKNETVVDAVIAASGSGSEPETFSSDKQSTAIGLTAALRAVLPGRDRMSGGAYVLCDLNGESYRAVEWGLAAVRLGDALGGVKRIVHPANGWGDIGAATGGGLLVLAAASFRRGYAPLDEAIVFAGTDGALRAAVRVERG